MALSRIMIAFLILLSIAGFVLLPITIIYGLIPKIEQNNSLIEWNTITNGSYIVSHSDCSINIDDDRCSYKCFKVITTVGYRHPNRTWPDWTEKDVYASEDKCRKRAVPEAYAITASLNYHNNKKIYILPSSEPIENNYQGQIAGYAFAIIIESIIILIWIITLCVASINTRCFTKFPTFNNKSRTTI